MPSTPEFQTFSPIRWAALRGITLVLAGFSAAGPAVGQECYYTWERIRDPGGGSCSGNALNNHGVVAGTVSYTGDNTRAFTWSADTGLVILPLPPGHSSMSAHGINDLGQVVGPLGGINGPGGGFNWNMNTQTYTIINLPPFSFEMYVNDINNRGEVVGSLYHRYPPGPAFWDPYIWQDGEWTFLGGLTAPRTGWANAINELGDIVGQASDGQWHAFLIRDRSELSWLPAPGSFTASRAYGLNNNGLIVGRAGPAAVVWSRAAVHLVFPPDDLAVACFESVNDAGQVLGTYYGQVSGTGGAIERPFVWQSGTINDVFWMMEPRPTSIYPGGRGINQAGQFVAVYGSGSLLVTPAWAEGDLTGDCHVGLDDLSILLANFGAPPGTFPQGDVDLDGEVDLTDLALLLVHFGE